MKKQTKTNNYERNNKQPIPAMHENPRYTGKCSGAPGKCKYCTGTEDNSK